MEMRKHPGVPLRLYLGWRERCMHAFVILHPEDEFVSFFFLDVDILLKCRRLMKIIIPYLNLYGSRFRRDEIFGNVLRM